MDQSQDPTQPTNVDFDQMAQLFGGYKAIPTQVAQSSNPIPFGDMSQAYHANANDNREIPGAGSQTPVDAQNIPQPALSQDAVQNMVQQRTAQEWGPQEWPAMYRLLMNESGFNPNAQNPTSTAHGLFQFLDSTWDGTGIDKTDDPAGQTEAGIKYIKSRYGTPSKALDFWYNVAPTLSAGNGSHWY